MIYVWFDALCNYVTALGPPRTARPMGRATGAGGRTREPRPRARQGRAAIPRRLLAGHAAVVRAAAADRSLRARLPDRRRPEISKSGTGAALSGALEPAGLAAAYGTDAVRWWLLREVPRVGDADFTVGRLVARADDELANGLGNLVNRVVAMIHRYRGGRVPGGPGFRWPPAGRLAASCREAGRGRRGAGGVRLPAGDGRGLADRRRGERLRQPGPPVGAGQDRTGRRAAARRGARPVLAAGPFSAGS